MLIVGCANPEDVYRDIARVPENYRKDFRGRAIKEGSVCLLSCGGRRSFVLLRGLPGSQEPQIRLDERKRNELCLEAGKTAEFSFSKAGLLGELRWAWQASDPAYRVTARLAVLSLALGLIGLSLGIVSLCR